MNTITKEWNLKQAKLKEIILKKENFDEAKNLLLELHSILHSSMVYGKNITLIDDIWSDLSEKAFRTMPTDKDVTIAWDIWHITRIEDITVNILIADDKSVLDENWLKILNTRVKDTGNSMTDDEIIAFSNEISMKELFNYRNAVGIRTKSIIENLKQEDMKRKFKKSQLMKIFEDGGVTEHQDSFWLLDFWSKKNVAGIFLMPVTRHQIVHLNDCMKLKEKFKRIFR